jgi:hypothetical protein
MVFDVEFNKLVRFFGGLVPHSYTSTQYDSFEAMKADYIATGRIKINVDHSSGTIFGDQSVNWLFRAWHDYCHLLVDAPFTADGERLAALEQCRQIEQHPGLTTGQKETFKRIVGIEVNGQVAYYVEHNDFPPNQYDFFLSEWFKPALTQIDSEWDAFISNPANFISEAA